MSFMNMTAHAPEVNPEVPPLDKVEELVLKLPARVVLTTSGESPDVLEIRTTDRQIYDGKASYDNASGGLITPPAANSREVKVTDVRSTKQRLQITYYPAHTEAVHHQSTHKTPAGFYPEDKARSISISGPNGQKVDTDNAEVMETVIAFLEKAFEQGQKDVARSAAQIGEERRALREQLIDLL